MQFLKTLGISVYPTPPQMSEVNGTVERVHSTIIEIIRCLQNEYRELTLKKVIHLHIAADRYNNSIHSVTKKVLTTYFLAEFQVLNNWQMHEIRSTRS